MPLALILLAAGASERLGQPKALARLSDDPPRTPLSSLLQAAAGCSEARPLVVTGKADRAIRLALPAGVEALHHPSWASGRTGSLAAAAAARPGHDLLVAPVDVPLVDSATFQALLHTWDKSGRPPRGWLAPRLLPELAEPGGPTHGHPLLMGRGLALDLAFLAPDEPLRRLRQRAEPLLEVTVEDPAILDDLDGPGDLERLRSRLRLGGS